MSEIIIGVDGSERAEDAIAFGRVLARACGAAIKLAATFPQPDWPLGTVSGEYGEYLHEETGAMLERMRGALDEEDVALCAIADPSPAGGLHRLAERDGAAMIVIGSTHRGRVGRVLPGSTADRLLHGAPCPVAIVPRDYRLGAGRPPAVVGVGFDGSDESHAAVTAATDVAKRLGARLRVIRVFEPGQLGTPAMLSGPAYVGAVGELQREAEGELRDLVAGLPEDMSVESVFVPGVAGRELAIQSEGLDLLLLGSRGYGPLRAVLLGGVSHVVVRQAACPVIVLPRGARNGVDELFPAAAEATA